MIRGLKMKRKFIAAGTGFYIFFAAFFLFSECSGTDKSSSSGRKNSGEFQWAAFEGFSCSPENQPADANPKRFCAKGESADYLYFHVASFHDAKSDYNAKIQSCKKNLSKLLTPSYLGDSFSCYIEQSSGCDMQDHEQWYKMLKKHILKTGVLNCCILDPETGRCSKTSEYEQCHCTYYMEINGGEKTFQEVYEAYNESM